MIIRFPLRRVRRRSSTTPKLDTLAVGAALNGRRSYWTLTAAEVAEVLRVLRRRGSSLEVASWLLDIDRHIIAEQYANAGAPS